MDLVNNNINNKNKCNFNVKLYLVTDRLNLNEDVFLEKIKDAIVGGVTLVQLREKNIGTREYIELAKKVKSITDKYDVPLIIDDRIDVVLATNASGVHLGAEDMEIIDARRILGDSYIIGATAKTVERAIKCQNEGADYLGCGAVFPTTTKVKTVLTSVDTIKKIKESVKIPVVAIGGLNKDNLDILKNSRVDGISVVSAIMKSDDPKNESSKLVELIGEL